MLADILQVGAGLIIGLIIGFFVATNESLQITT